MQCPNRACNATVDEVAVVCPRCGTFLDPSAAPPSYDRGAGRLAAGSAALATCSGCLLFVAVLLVWLPGPSWYQWRPPFVWGIAPKTYLPFYGTSVAALGMALAAIIAGHVALLAVIIKDRLEPRIRGVLWLAFFGISLGSLVAVPIALLMSLFNTGVSVIALGVALTAIVAGHATFVIRGRRVLKIHRVPWRAFFGMSLGGLLAILIALPMSTIMFGKSRHSVDRAACGDNLRRIEIRLRQYAERNREMFPPLSTQPGVLMFSPEVIPPEDDLLRSLTCPTVRYSRKGTAGYKVARMETPPFDDHSYFYLGYAVLNDDAVEAFAQAYRKKIAEGGTFDEDLVVEDREGTHVLHRLSIGVKEVLSAAQDRLSVSPNAGREAYYQVPGVVTTDVPLLIERDLGHVSSDWDGPPRGAYVLYLNVGLQFVERGTWPITEKTQRILAELAE